MAGIGKLALFSQYTIGTAELIASSLLLGGMFFLSHRFLQPLGALLGLAIITGAISFHMFTPLGIDPDNDGGGLFAAACSVWIGCLALLIFRMNELGTLGRNVGQFLAPAG